MNEFAIQNYFHSDRRIEVVYRRRQNLPLIVIMIILSVFWTIPLLASSIKNSMYLAIFVDVLFFGGLAVFIIYLKRNSARLFDINGVTRGDGRFFSWSDFRGTVTLWSSSRSMGRTIRRIDLYFVGGQVFVGGTMMNGKEVLDFVKSLPALR